MKKIWLISTSVLVVIFSLIYLSYLNSLEPLEKENSNSQPSVEMSIVAGTRNVVALRLTNNTNYIYSYGYSFILEVNIGNDWNIVNFRPSQGYIIPIAYFLYPKSYVYRYIYLHSKFGRLSPGKYRIIKEILPYDITRKQLVLTTVEFMITR